MREKGECGKPRASEDVASLAREREQSEVVNKLVKNLTDTREKRVAPGKSSDADGRRLPYREGDYCE